MDTVVPNDNALQTQMPRRIYIAACRISLHDRSNLFCGALFYCHLFLLLFVSLF